MRRSQGISFFRNTIYCLALVSGGSWAQDSIGTVTLELSGLAQASGNIYIAVYNSTDNWLSDEPDQGSIVAIEDARVGELVRTSLQLPAGDYAITLFHDSNDNGKLDTNFIGIPKEPMALSNNARAKFGPPRYEDAVFTIGTEPVVQQLSVGEL